MMTLLFGCSEGRPSIATLNMAGLHGTTISLEEIKQAPATVFAFFSPDCPLSENYSLTLNRLNNAFSGQHVQCYMVFAGTSYSVQEIDSFCLRFHPNMPVLLDTDYTLTHTLGATITPEAFLVDSTGAERYHGKIDNWAFSLGKQRLKATEHYLRDALEAVLSGQDPPVNETDAVGCLIE